MEYLIWLPSAVAFFLFYKFLDWLWSVKRQIANFFVGEFRKISEGFPEAKLSVFIQSLFIFGITPAMLVTLVTGLPAGLILSLFFDAEYTDGIMIASIPTALVFWSIIAASYDGYKIKNKLPRFWD